MAKIDQSTIIVGGQARLPKELSTGVVLQVVVELDAKSSQILDVCSSPSLSLINDLLKDILIGTKLREPIENILEAVEKRLVHRSRKAICTAIKDLHREYAERQQGLPRTMDRPEEDYPRA